MRPQARVSAMLVGALTCAGAVADPLSDQLTSEELTFFDYLGMMVEADGELLDPVAVFVDEDGELVPGNEVADVPVTPRTNDAEQEGER